MSNCLNYIMEQWKWGSSQVCANNATLDVGISHNLQNSVWKKQTQSVVLHEYPKHKQPAKPLCQSFTQNLST